MINVKIKNGKVKIKANGYREFVICEIAFAAAGCINEICKDQNDFDSMVKEVINELSKFNLSADGNNFEIR